jgi:hypothetical protein
MVDKTVTCNGHDFEVETGETYEKAFYDGAEVSSLELGSGVHVFEVEENGEQVHYQLVITHKETWADEDRPYAPCEDAYRRDLYSLRRNERETSSLYYAAISAPNRISPKRLSLNIAIVRNGRVILNDGVPTSRILEALKENSLSCDEEESPEFGVCTNCNIKVEVPNAHYRPHCREKLKMGSIVGAFSWKRRKTQ